MSDARSGGLLAGPFIMLLSAAIFAYFGFFIGLTSTTAGGQFVFFFALLMWTVKIAAVAFAVSALVTFVAPLPGNLLYSVVGLLSSLALVVVGVMDIADPQYVAAMPPLLAFLFAAWNGYGSWTGLKAVLRLQRAANDGQRSFGPP